MAKKDKPGKKGERVVQGYVKPATRTCGTCRGSKKIDYIPRGPGGIFDKSKKQRIDCTTCGGTGEVPNR